MGVDKLKMESNSYLADIEYKHIDRPQNLIILDQEADSCSHTKHVVIIDSMIAIMCDKCNLAWDVRGIDE